MWTDLFNNHIYIYITIICVQITYCLIQTSELGCTIKGGEATGFYLDFSGNFEFYFSKINKTCKI